MSTCWPHDTLKWHRDNVCRLKMRFESNIYTRRSDVIVITHRHAGGIMWTKTELNAEILEFVYHGYIWCAIPRKTVIASTHKFSTIHCCNIVYLQYGGVYYCIQNDIDVTSRIHKALVSESLFGCIVLADTIWAACVLWGFMTLTLNVQTFFNIRRYLHNQPVRLIWTPFDHRGLEAWERLVDLVTWSSMCLKLIVLNHQTVTSLLEKLWHVFSVAMSSCDRNLFIYKTDFYFTFELRRGKRPTENDIDYKRHCDVYSRTSS